MPQKKLFNGKCPYCQSQLQLFEGLAVCPIGDYEVNPEEFEKLWEENNVKDMNRSELSEFLEKLRKLNKKKEIKNG